MNETTIKIIKIGCKLTSAIGVSILQSIVTKYVVKAIHPIVMTAADDIKKQQVIKTMKNIVNKENK